jgi:hypothetical protein
MPFVAIFCNVLCGSVDDLIKIESIWFVDREENHWF